MTAPAGCEQVARRPPVWAVASRATIPLAVVVAVAVETWDPSTVLADVCYVATLTGAGVAAWIGARRWPRHRRLLPLFTAAGLAANALGEGLWAGLVRSGADVDVSVADAAWFASYVFLCLAVWRVLQDSRGESDVGWDLVIDVATTATVSVLLFWRFSVADVVDDATVSAAVRAVWASYPILDAILLALTVRMLLRDRGRGSVNAWFAVGVCLWLTADLMQLHTMQGPAAVRVMNAAWMLAPVLMAAAVWRSADAPPRSSPEPRGGWVPQVALATCPLLVPPTLEVLADLRGDPDRPYQLVVGMTAVIALAFVRTGRLVRSEHRAHQELQTAHETAMAALEAKSMFLANISHEIRTPLTTVLGTADLLNSSTLTPGQRKLVDMQRRSGAHLLTLVDSTLDFARLKSDQVILDIDEVNLPELVEGIIESHQQRALARDNSCTHDTTRQVPELVRGDATRLTQVLNNLLVNALKFTEHGHVHLAVRALDGDTVSFSVSDTGIGIPEADQERVFESFSQVDASATRRYEGTGLGLAICKELTELMGGTISMTSTVGEGSTFAVQLPLPHVRLRSGPRNLSAELR